MEILKRNNGLFFAQGFMILVVPEFLKVYFIMPFPGSQHENHVELAYNMARFIWVTRILGAALLLPATYYLFSSNGMVKKLVVGFALVFGAAVVYATNFVMLADKIFYQAETKLMLAADKSAIDKEKLVIGVTINGEAKAYPIYIIGYHHQVRDTVGGQPVMVTYCTVCRTGRVYKPEVDGKPETFRLVGMDQFNAMFEDATTKSWWRQVNAECIAGPLKGKQLPELPSEQMSLARWTELHPNTQIMQPDPKFAEAYVGLAKYDEGNYKSMLEGSDTASFQPKSWVVGLVVNKAAKIYDWNLLKQKRSINDTVGGEPIILILENDNKSFHAFSRKAEGGALNLQFDAQNNLLIDSADHSKWYLDGHCVNKICYSGDLKPVQAYQEFYHSFTTFHPGATVYK